MSLADLIRRKNAPVGGALATVATVATVGPEPAPLLSSLAAGTVATACYGLLQMEIDPATVANRSNRSSGKDGLSGAPEPAPLLDSYSTVARIATVAVATPRDEKIEAPEARRRWLIRHADGSLFEHSFTPPATLAEVLEYYPDATEAEPLEHPQPARAAEEGYRSGPDTPDALRSARGAAAWTPDDIAEAVAERAAIREFDGGAPREEAERKAFVEVACCACRHWRPDRVNPAGGLGSCLVGSPASRRPGSLWPTGEVFCRDWEGLTC